MWGAEAMLMPCATASGTPMYTICSVNKETYMHAGSAGPACVMCAFHCGVLESSAPLVSAPAVRMAEVLLW